MFDRSFVLKYNIGFDAPMQEKALDALITFLKAEDADAGRSIGCPLVTLE